MTIKIKLTNKEFAVVAAIAERNSKYDEVSVDPKVFNKLEEFGLIERGKGWFDLSSFGEIAFAQNKPKELALEQVDPSYKLCVEFWLKELHPGWTFTATHGKSMKTIIAKLRAGLAAHMNGSEKPTAEQIVFKFKQMCTLGPPFYRDKDLPKLDSGFNEIITFIVNGPTKGGYHQQNSAERMFGV